MEEIIGHRRAVERLARVAAQQAPAHAYLFVGPPHVGKRTVARWFARALVCEGDGPAPCGRCRACGLVHAGRHPDVRAVDLEAQRHLLGEKRPSAVYKVELVRRLQADWAIRPLEAPWKVLIVERADRMTPQAANAFLKTLEEPPPFVVLILTALDEENLLPTIRSRCQLVRLRPVPAGEIEVALRGRGADAEEARRLARLSGGRVGWAIRALDEPAVVAAYQEAVELLERLLRATRSERLQEAERLARRPDGLDILAWWLTWWRDMWLRHHGVADALGLPSPQGLQEAAGRLSPLAVYWIVRRVERSARILEETNVNPELVWDTVVLGLPRLGDGGRARKANRGRGERLAGREMRAPGD
ncbi:MAG: DNA polymerase III subunit delta' [Ardenticatenia bacterium]|nr:DNA polymerase III subunit delta' [Ardenticatenia bacterium]